MKFLQYPRQPVNWKRNGNSIVFMVSNPSWKILRNSSLCQKITRVLIEFLLSEGHDSPGRVKPTIEVLHGDPNDGFDCGQLWKKAGTGPAIAGPWHFFSMEVDVSHSENVSTGPVWKVFFINLNKLTTIAIYYNHIIGNTRGLILLLVSTH